MEKDLTKNELIIYNHEILDLSGQIKQIQTPIKTLNPEARTIFDKGMYVAGFCKMKFDVGGINGIAYIKLLELLERKSTANDSLLEKMSQKLFNCNLINDDSLIEHEEKKYKEKWKVNSTNYYPSNLIWISNNGSINAENLIKKLKTKIANEKNILFTNEFIYSLFSPILNPMAKLYEGIIGY